MTTLQQLNKHIQLTEIRFPDYIVRGGLFLGEKTAVVWDSLSHPGDMLALLPLIAGRQVTVIYSHADWDHIWGTAALAGAGLTVIGHRRCRQRFDEDVPLTLRERRLAEPGLWEAVRLMPPDIVFDREYRLDLGEFTLELRALPGHTPDSVVGLVPEYGLLFMGDTVETPLPCLPPDCPLQEWLAGLEHWLHDPRVRIVIPAHGPWGGREIISRTIAYLQDLAAGRPRLDADDLSPFYRQTHLENLRNCA